MTTTNDVKLRVHWQNPLTGTSAEAEINTQVNHVEEDLRAVKAAIHANFGDLPVTGEETPE